MVKAFISYSHQNDRALDRLHTHLAMLRRDGLITEWHDREIHAGKEINREVQCNLNGSQIFLALVSPEFLASDYCYEREMAIALERHKTETLQVIPIIIAPCEWQVSPLKDLKALPKDGKPISTWTNEDVAYLNAVSELRRVLTAESAEPHVRSSPRSAELSKAPQSKQYRIKREFDTIDRSDFSRKSFEIIRDYFRDSVGELTEIGDPIRARFENMSEIAFTCTVLNKGKRSKEAHITIHLTGDHAFGDIIYSFTHRATNNTSNGHVSIEDDEYEQFLTLSSFRIRSEKERRSATEIAATIWQEFISQAGIDYD